jgi:hypothetical protein
MHAQDLAVRLISKVNDWTTEIRFQLKEVEFPLLHHMQSDCMSYLIHSMDTGRSVMQNTNQARLIIHVGFEVFTAAVTKSIISWDITPCSPLKSTDVSEDHNSIFRVED